MLIVCHCSLYSNLLLACHNTFRSKHRFKVSSLVFESKQPKKHISKNDIASLLVESLAKSLDAVNRRLMIRFGHNLFFNIFYFLMQELVSGTTSLDGLSFNPILLSPQIASVTFGLGLGLAFFPSLLFSAALWIFPGPRPLLEFGKSNTKHTNFLLPVSTKTSRLCLAQLRVLPQNNGDEQRFATRRNTNI